MAMKRRGPLINVWFEMVGGAGGTDYRLLATFDLAGRLARSWSIAALYFMNLASLLPVSLLPVGNLSFIGLICRFMKYRAARNWLADAGYDPVYGARPLKRVIQRVLQNPLATMVLEGKIADGESVEVTVAKGGLAINGVVAEAA